MLRQAGAKRSLTALRLFRQAGPNHQTTQGTTQARPGVMEISYPPGGLIQTGHFWVILDSFLMKPFFGGADFFG